MRNSSEELVIVGQIAASLVRQIPQKGARNWEAIAEDAWALFEAVEAAQKRRGRDLIDKPRLSLPKPRPDVTLPESP